MKKKSVFWGLDWKDIACLLISIPIIILTWRECSWVCIFPVIIGVGLIMLAIEGFIRLFKKEKPELISDQPSEHDIYEENMKVLTDYFKKLELFGKIKHHPKEGDFDHSFDRIKEAFNLVLNSKYLTDEEMRDILMSGELHFIFFIMDSMPIRERY